MRDTETGHTGNRRWTVIIIRRFGRISSHELSGFWLKLAAILLILILAGSSYLLYENRKLTEERTRLLAKLVLPPSEVEAGRPLALAQTPTGPSAEPAETSVSPTTTKPQEPSTTTTTTTTTTLPAEPATTTSTLPAEPAAAQTEEKENQPPAEGAESESEKIAINDINLVRLVSPKGLKISFKLLNRSSGGRRLSGYIFVLAKNNGLQEPLIGTYPNSATIENDSPTEIKKGAAFSIYQFKTIRGRIYAKDEIEEVVILVYDQDGQLLFSQDYPVPADA